MGVVKGIVKLLLVLAIFIILSLFAIYVSAQAPTTKSYNPSTKTITINSAGNKIVEIQLISNTDQCLVDCEAIIRIKPYSTLIIPSSPNDNFKWDFIKSDPKSPDLQGYSFELLETIPYAVYNYKEVCNPYEIKDTNGTQTISNCTAVPEFSHIAYRQEYKPFSFWGYTFEAGKDYTIKLKGKKIATQGNNNIEWIPTFYGLQLNEWAWWNSSWQYTQPLSIYNLNDTILLTEYHPIRVKINTASLISGGKMRNDCQDARFVYNNITKMDYNVTSCNSASTIFDFQLRGKNIMQNTNDTSFNFYYGNSAANYTAKNRTTVNSTRPYDNNTQRVILDFNEQAGTTVYDQSGNGKNSTVFSNVSWNTSGYFDGGLSFSSGISTLGIPDSIDIRVEYNRNWTVDFWLWWNGQSPDPGSVFVEKGSNLETCDFTDNWEYGFYANGGKAVARMRSNNGGGNIEVTSITLINDSKWHHIALTSNTSADKYQLYVDGRLEASATNIHTATIQNTCRLSFGASQRDVSAGAYNYTVDGFRLWNDTMTTAQLNVLRPEPLTALGTEIPLSYYASEVEGDQAIVNGIVGSLGPGATILTDQQIYIVNTEGGHSKGSFDKAALYGNQTWAFNYITDGESFTNITSLFQTVNIWENQTLTSADIESRVGAFINQTKG